jgi:hypothetical protein
VITICHAGGVPRSAEGLARRRSLRREAGRLIRELAPVARRKPQQVGRLLGLTRRTVCELELAAMIKILRWAKAHRLHLASAPSGPQDE